MITYIKRGMPNWAHGLFFLQQSTGLPLYKLASAPAAPAEQKSTPFNLRGAPHAFAATGSIDKFFHQGDNPAMDGWHQHLSDGCVKFVKLPEFFKIMECLGDTEPTCADLGAMVSSAQAAFDDLVVAVTNAKQEKDFNPQMAEYFDALFSGCESARRPRFCDKSNYTFDPVVKTDYKSRPDIAGSVFGFDLDEDEWRWLLVVIAMELKLRRTQDIFAGDQVPPLTDKRKQADLTQLLHNPRRIMMATRVCASFTASVFNRWARLVYVDRSGYIVSEEFDWVADCVVFPEFLWRVYNSRSSGHVLGADETVTVPTEEDKERMLPLLYYALGKTGPLAADAVPKELLHAQGQLRDSRWLTIYAGKGKKLDRCLTVGRPIHQVSGMFCRGTRVDRVLLESDLEKVFPVVKRNQHLTVKYPILDTPATAPHFYALKDAWQQACRDPEYLFYRIIEEHMKEAHNGEAAEGLAVLAGHIELNKQRNVKGHETITARMRPDGSPEEDRAHRRTLTCHVGTRLDNLMESIELTPGDPGFKSTKEAVQVILDAIKGHRLAYAAGILQRDVSIGNVLKLGASGFLHDFDISALTERGRTLMARVDPKHMPSTLDKLKKSLTGTFAFLALGVLEARHFGHLIEHKPKHDLESFYWLLIWLLLRYTSHTAPSGKQAPYQLFDHPDYNTARSTKITWLRDQSQAYRRGDYLWPDNAPLSVLVGELTGLVKANDDGLINDRESITYDSVIGLFEKALAAPGWKEGDAIPFIPPKYVRQETPIENARTTGALDVRARVPTNPPDNPFSAPEAFQYARVRAELEPNDVYHDDFDEASSSLYRVAEEVESDADVAEVDADSDSEEARIVAAMEALRLRQAAEQAELQAQLTAARAARQAGKGKERARED
uniref:Fungal-type protein kinase domain-containing protein n=1 Tax=Mycena chlorophos TaxID=658473 RepID=A0ABQ0MB87_MYCCL|nr:predicted protein [Mycena chlorophos]